VVAVPLVAVLNTVVGYLRRYSARVDPPLQSGPPDIEKVKDPGPGPGAVPEPEPAPRPAE
ncbi:AI-2E family transporter, partial [Streptomyces sp. SID11233]|nr:AI-2E family transporter [Streptomyces sp. SID11233]